MLKDLNRYGLCILYPSVSVFLERFGRGEKLGEADYALPSEGQVLSPFCRKFRRIDSAKGVFTQCVTLSSYSSDVSLNLAALVHIP